VLTKGVESTGAVICGRRTYDDSITFWGADGPTGAARLRLFVVSHSAPADVPEGGVYHFVLDGIEHALAEAKARRRGEERVCDGRRGHRPAVHPRRLVEELSIHLVPLMFGGGTRMFEDLGEQLRQLDVIEVVPGPTATHIRYRLR
jgi:dihydrofolate reductase